jgi:hypothetical protein
MAFEPKFSGAVTIGIGLPELRGEIVSGKIISKTKKTGTKNVALSLPGNPFGFKIAQTDRDGHFIFVLDKNLNQAQAVLQVMEPDREEYAIVLDQDKRPDYSQLSFGTLRLDDAAKAVVAQRTVASQIENAYFERKKDSILASSKAYPFYHSLEKTYVLDDYTRFPTLRETIIEVIKEMYFTSKRDNYEIHLRNMTMNNEQYGQALILVDGLLVQDHNALFAYGAKYIEKVDLINEPYVYGPKTFSGLANFTTKLQDFKNDISREFYKKVTLERPQPQKRYFTAVYTNNRSRIPDYRHQLLWIPDISGDVQEIVFYTSDVRGEFQINIQGFTDSGTPVSLTTTFEVK